MSRAFSTFPRRRTENDGNVIPAVIGRKVNLAARLMSKYSDVGVVCDEDTYQRSVLLMGPNNFKELEWRKLKGIEHMGRVFQVQISTEE